MNENLSDKNNEWQIIQEEFEDTKVVIRMANRRRRQTTQ